MKEEPSRIVKIKGIEYSLNLDDTMQASVLRALTGTTPLDDEVDNLTMPQKPIWLRMCVRILRWYRTRLSPQLGQRCVYEPSCSRYTELSLRKYGFFKGLYFSTKRLHRCRPGAGGIDMP